MGSNVRLAAPRLPHGVDDRAHLLTAPLEHRRVLQRLGGSLQLLRVRVFCDAELRASGLGQMGVPTARRGQSSAVRPCMARGKPSCTPPMAQWRRPSSSLESSGIEPAAAAAAAMSTPSKECCAVWLTEALQHAMLMRPQASATAVSALSDIFDRCIASDASFTGHFAAARATSLVSSVLVLVLRCKRCRARHPMGSR